MSLPMERRERSLQKKVRSTVVSSDTSDEGARFEERGQAARNV